MAQDDPKDRLKRAMACHMALRVPRAGDRDLKDADVALFEEAAYVFGIADAAATGRPSPVNAIRLDVSIDERLNNAALEAGADAQVIDDFKRFRKSVRDMARLAGEVLGISLEETGRSARP